MTDFDKMLNKYLDESTPKKIKNSNRSSSYRHRAKKKRTEERLKVLEYGYKPSIGSDKGGYWVGAHNSNAQRWLKKASNKKVRRSNHIGQYGEYKKLFDYWNMWF